MTESLGILPVLKASVAETWARKNEFLRISWFPFLLLIGFFASYSLYAGAVTRVLETVFYIKGQPYTIHPDVLFQVFISAIMSGWLIVPLFKKVLYGIQSKEIPVDLRLGGHEAALVSLPVHFSPDIGALRYGLLGWFIVGVFFVLETGLGFYLNYFAPGNFLHALPFRTDLLVSVLFFVLRCLLTAPLMFALIYLAVARTLKWADFVAAIRATKGHIVYIVVTNYLIFLPYYLPEMLSSFFLYPVAKDHMTALYAVFYLDMVLFYLCTLVWVVYACRLYKRFMP